MGNPTLCGSGSMSEATIRKHVLNNHRDLACTWACSACEAICDKNKGITGHFPKCPGTKGRRNGLKDMCKVVLKGVSLLRMASAKML